MSGAFDSSQTTTSKQQPYAPTIPFLRDILNGLHNGAMNFQPTAYQQAALDQLKSNANKLPNFGPQATNLTNQFLTGDPNNLLMPALQNYQTAMNPIATADLDPTKTPGLANVLSTIRSDIGNDVNGLFAGAGRDLSGMHVQALGRGISQGEAPALLNQYNQNVAQRQAAASGLLGASGATSTAMGQNQATGLNMVNGLPSIINQGPNAMLSAAQTAHDLPLQNIAKALGIVLPIAGLGSQSQSTSTYSPSMMSSIQQGAQLAGTALGLGGSMASMPMMSGGFNPFGAFTGNYFPGNSAAQGAGYGYYGGQYYPMF